MIVSIDDQKVLIIRLKVGFEKFVLHLTITLRLLGTEKRFFFLSRVDDSIIFSDYRTLLEQYVVTELCCPSNDQSSFTIGLGSSRLAMAVGGPLETFLQPQICPEEETSKPPQQLCRPCPHVVIVVVLEHFNDLRGRATHAWQV